ncbi:hypothetical protein INT43_002122 [Umbelopsis isabellina]|uniref:PRELI/MSF1 domain-containing protein n=1 Tax=Mortierella isabellina TaxID=91625 RepID=A0A8H7UF29_MORIS|nr:hypothetical protein INT43_002122 [Umbelopsis isabellina]
MTVTPLTRYIYPYDWDLAVIANQARYPCHPSVPVLLGADVVTDEIYLTSVELDQLGLSHSCIRPTNNNNNQEMSRIDADFVLPSEIASIDLVPRVGIRRIVRNCRLKVDFPALLRKAVNVSELIVKHETVIDSRTSTLTVTSTNETLTGLVHLGDVTVYRGIKPDEKFDNAVVLGAQSSQNPHCLFEQHAYLDIRVKIPFKSAIESHILKTYRKNTSDGRKLDMDLMEAAQLEQEQSRIEERIKVGPMEKSSESPRCSGNPNLTTL